MTTPCQPRPKARPAPPAKPASLRPPEPAAEGSDSALLGLQRTAGNRAVGQLLGGIVEEPERRSGHPPMVQRKPDEGAEAAPEGGPEPAVGPANEDEPPAPAAPGSEAPAAETAPAPALVVGDEAEAVGPGQMKKSEFFTLLRAQVCAAAEDGLAGTPYSAQGCPLIEFWLGYYEGQDVERINRDLPRFAGDGPRPASAEEYVGLIAERVAAGVAAWARTGEVSGVPAGIPLPGMGMPGLGALGGSGLGSLLGGGGGVFFRAKPGGARQPGDPAAIQARLGAGRPLDGGLRSRMESAFGRRFAHVRVHDDGGAAGLAAGLNAKAFTVGEHVAFGAREYRPGTLAGDALIAHELAHVAQQDAGAAAAAGYEALERDADLAGASAVASLWGGRALAPPAPRVRSGLRLQRCGGCGKKATTAPAAAGSPAANAPTGDSLAAVTAAAPFAGTEVTLGFTQVDEAASRLECRPDFTPDAAAGTCSFTQRPVLLALTSRYVKPGKYPHPQGRTMSSARGELPIVFDITDPVSELAKAGEEEHVKDLQLAFDRTLKPCSEAMARLAGTAMTGRNAGECFEDMKKRLGFDPAACTHEFRRLRDATEERDRKKWHTFEPYRDSVSESGAIYRFRPARTNKIADKVPPEAVVPEATGCSAPAAAPASPPAPAPEKETP